MDTDTHGLLLENETQKIIGCAMEALNALGHGLLEKPQENALVVEFGLRGIAYEQQYLQIIPSNIDLCISVLIRGSRPALHNYCAGPVTFQPVWVY
ncbi:GxxExxY protein [Candidatus Bipolaricaulota bacterium]|nr:GxxExxY protein [Candidatus Bipolaricaulota bacterium]